ncbi:MAG TPA: AI-2E family transporter [Flavobacteriales bacterium]|nr:AI-2E family transporter [Flavobacteriales bacterium]|tara:strand:- start:20897 stop:21946 length:1050 start_codon:yes stop_codon:yes gene_type:complete
MGPSLNNLNRTNNLLTIMVVVLVFYLLKILSFIFIPLTFGMFMALLFLPIMRWLRTKGLPKWLSIGVIIGIIALILKLFGELVKLSSREIINADSHFFQKAESKFTLLIGNVESFFGIERIGNDNVLLHYLSQANVFGNFGNTLDFIGDTLTMALMTIFFGVLLLMDSFNFERVLTKAIFKSKSMSIRTFLKIEKDIARFLIVKFLVSFGTGVGFSIACYSFDVSFPIFWGVFAFLINFVQMVGSVISVVLLSIFAFVEIEAYTVLLAFSLIITGVQVLFGAVLEPIFMGKTFSLNVVTVLVMLMLWGFIWGVPGLIMAIPITVILKIILEQIPSTRMMAEMMSGGSKV